jgi:hypothetical protein
MHIHAAPRCDLAPAIDLMRCGAGDFAERLYTTILQGNIRHTVEDGRQDTATAEDQVEFGHGTINAAPADGRKRLTRIRDFRPCGRLTCRLGRQFAIHFAIHFADVLQSLFRQVLFSTLHRS